MDALAKPAEGWWIQVRGAAYGPYTPDQMRQYILEGRVKPNSLVSPTRDGGWRALAATPDFAETPAPTLRSTVQSTVQASPKKAEPEAANIFVFAEIHSGAWMHFMAALEAMGRLAELAPGFFLLRSRLSSGAVRNALSQTLAQGDRFVVVDATRDRLAWFNMGPGPEVSIREVWSSGTERRP